MSCKPVSPVIVKIDVRNGALKLAYLQRYITEYYV
jgi:hypothetical protein